MTIQNAYSETFSMPSHKSAQDIREACQKLESIQNPHYVVKHNGNHIWLKAGSEKEEFSSPLLHLSIEKTPDNQTFVKGEYVVSPFSWVSLLAFKMCLLAITSATLVALYYKVFTGSDFRNEIVVLAAMIVLFGLQILISEWNKKRAKKQIHGLQQLMNSIV